MRDIFIISDTHFGHENIIKYCNRPFANADEMNEALIENWNRVVKDSDIVYHLGDVYFGQKGRVLDRLKGRKRLVLGNHDTVDAYLLQHFQKIMVWRMFPDMGLLLTHVPIHPHSFEDEHGHDRKGKYDVNVHGHIHDKTVMRKAEYIKNALIPDVRYKCVSVEHINYTPVSVEELRTRR